MNDENVYPDPAKFDPERFLTSDEKVDHSVRDHEAAFGYGRRIWCILVLRVAGTSDLIGTHVQSPGRHMARGTIWLTAASILASFNVEKAVDAHGNVIEPHVEYVPNLIR